MSGDSLLVSLEWEAVRNAQSTKAWTELIHALSNRHDGEPAENANTVCLTYERAIRAIPASYKLWTHYIKYRIEVTRKFCRVNEWFLSVRETYERAVGELSIMPQLWVSYIKFVMGFPTPKVTMIRHLIGRSLAALPVTQHKWIWAVTKKWTLAAAVPSQTVKLLWSAYFVFNPSLSAKREYLELLLSRGDVDFFVKECVAFRNEETLISDLFFWENMTNALRTPGWHFTGDVAELEELIHKGRILSSSETLLMLSFGLFLVGQGRIVEGRGCISQFLQDSPEVESFLTAFAAAVEVENQLVDSFVLESNASTVDDETYNASVESIFGSRDVLSPLRRLIREFPLLYNQAQLHQQPLHVFLWLKRIETEKDRAVDSHQSEPVINTFKTAIARCTANFSVVDPAVGELFQSYVKELLRSGDSRSAVEIAEEGAWCTPFSTTSVNMELLGLLAELKVMFCDSKEQVSQYFIKKLTENAPESSRRARGALFSDRQPLEAVRKDPRAWSLAFDLLLSLQKNEEVELFVSKMFESGVISTELAVYVSSRLHQVGDNANAVKVMERSLALSKSNPLALLFLVSQYFSCMCSTGTMNIHRFREVYISAEEVMLPALREEPNFTVSFFMDCAALESRIGLGGNAELITLKLTMAAANTLRSSPSHDRLLEGMVETAICLKFKFRGIKEVRELCKTLINARDNPTFTARVAVQWASLENRMNNVEQARYVLRACAPTQNPDTAPEFWEFWESLCSTATEFEEVARKRKQVSIEFNNSA